MRRKLAAWAVGGAVLLLAGCASAGDGVSLEDDPVLISPPATIAAPTATIPQVTTGDAPVASMAPSVPPTTLPPLPTPAPPPLDRGAPGPQVGSIEIPKIGLNLPLFDGVNLATLDEGPGHWPGTAQPGELGNVVVAAHRVSHGGPFRRIDKLAAGDVVTFNIGNRAVTYVVTETGVVTPETIDIITQTLEPTATLFACHPPGSTKFRYVVKMKLAPTPT